MITRRGGSAFGPDQVPAPAPGTPPWAVVGNAGVAVILERRCRGGGGGDGGEGGRGDAAPCGARLEAGVWAVAEEVGEASGQPVYDRTHHGHHDRVDKGLLNLRCREGIAVRAADH